MGPAVSEPINPYASPQCAAGGPPAQALDLEEPILLQGEINLVHEVLVMRRLRGGGAQWIMRLLALLALCAALIAVYRFWQTGDRNMLWAAIMPALGAIFFSSFLWIFLGLHFAWLGLLGIPYQKSFWGLVTNAGLRTRGAAGEEFQPWSSFSRMELSGELIFLYGQGDLRAIPIVILNLHWCVSSADEERLLALLESRFGPEPAQLSDSTTSRDRSQLPAATHPIIAGEAPIVLAGLVDLDQLLRIGRLKRNPHVRKFVMIVVVLLAAHMAAILWWSESNPGSWAVCGFMMAVATLVYAICIHEPELSAWRLRRSYESGRAHPQWTTWTVSAAGVSLLTEALETHEAWNQLRYCGEAENMLVLSNQSSLRFHFLPREFATNQQWESLRQIVRENTVRNSP
jgi:hypothetical protein